MRLSIRFQSKFYWKQLNSISIEVSINIVYLLLKTSCLNDHPDGSRRPHVDQLRMSRDTLAVDGHPAEVIGVLPAERLEVSLQEQERALDSDQGFVLAGGQVPRGRL